MIKHRRKNRRIDVPTGSAGFVIKKQGSLSLVLPEGKRGRWQSRERIFRSLIYDRDHRVVSCGLPKFFMQSDDLSYKAEAQALLDQDGAIDASIKYDGSLIIRSVIRDRVVFRTRSSFDGDYYSDLVRDLAAEKYPLLNDPRFFPDDSLHFEFISPRQRVIINYPERDLVLIGAVSNQTLKMFDRGKLNLLAEEYHLRLAESIELPEDIDTLQEQIDGQLDIEGVVLCWGDKLLKIKNMRYEQAQIKRYSFHPRKIYSICKEKNLSDGEELLKALQLGEDDLLASYIADLWQRYRETQSDLDQWVDKLSVDVEEHRSLSRKQFSRHVSTLGLPASAAAIAIRQGEQSRARELLEQYLLKKRFGDPTEAGIG